MTYLLVGLSLTLMVLTAAHAVMWKRDGRTALGWLAYIGFGVNRVRRETRVADIGLRPKHQHASVPAQAAAYFEPLQHLTDQLSRFPLVSGNRVVALVNGDEAYPQMLAAIETAQRSIALSTYIFDNDTVGRRFVAALADAVARGVEVRTLVDAVGLRYSRPSLVHSLRAARIPFARFMPPLLPWRWPTMNLRDHRKLLIVDGDVAFTGGLNLRSGHVIGDHPKRPVRDVHFRLEGPIVLQLQHIFVEDWAFAARERLDGPAWFPAAPPTTGGGEARAIPGGPDEDFETIRLTLVGALATAKHHVRLVTPYFLPDPSLITALNVAALRGVRVDIVLPANNNNYLVKWASTASLWQVLERGCRVWLSPGDFDHSKLLVVDDVWTLLGTANWDPRSLRLNFELVVEVYDRTLARATAALVEARVEAARELRLDEVDGRPLLGRLRDGVARLLVGFL